MTRRSGRNPVAMMDSWVGDLKTARLFNACKRIQICHCIENPNSLRCTNPYYTGCYGCVRRSTTECSPLVYMFIRRETLISVCLCLQICCSLSQTRCLPALSLSLSTVLLSLPPKPHRTRSFQSEREEVLDPKAPNLMGFTVSTQSHCTGLLP